MTIEPLYSLAGVFVGVLVGLTGVGGGSLMTPILVLAFGFHPATAVGTDLLYAAATKTVGTTVHGWRGTLDWRIVRRLAMGSVPATIVTLLLLGRTSEHSPAMEHLLATLLGLVLIASAIATLLRHRIVAALTPRLGESEAHQPVWLTVLLGAVLGVMVSLTSVGAGALGMTALLVLYPRHPLKSLVGADIAHAVPLTLLAGAGHWLLGSVDLGLLGSLLIGSIPGIVVGSLLAGAIREGVLRPILAIVLAIVGVKLLL
ncbi:sulfite exporter TauE/SafE family protein [Sphingomonas sp. KR1UV-12]|uniref:Probable membrane transporter protein n=1 Tax=Sphingomonas aurea TaxID=3063994 RepID=A0ABT9EME1_9SPHN|nr:sulfite exporter TauE/SafE family protein [Sphingomonas sp. KR1UV-12]MDP1027976.1 sulfite exporter TauE/SafE family protein [Sphingomonas sp. KR1UV-12]